MVESKLSGARYTANFPTLTNQLYQLAAGTVTSDQLVRRSLDAIEASQSTIVALKQWIIHLERGTAEGT